ncbi:MAG: type II toxin-antitoxin system RelE/ParE family toxin [Synergistaceae bacterium]|nr:type II toxin-antitoxin system RelE/ParE family toxin [Synergistaceae bacterium]
MNRTWEIFYTKQAEQDLRSIYEYIAYSLVEPDTAKKQVRRIMDMISGLDQMPARFRLYVKEPWHNKGLRVMSVDNYLMFYLPLKAKRTVNIIRIMYSGRDIEKHF